MTTCPHSHDAHHHHVHRPSASSTDHPAAPTPVAEPSPTDSKKGRRRWLRRAAAGVAAGAMLAVVGATWQQSLRAGAQRAWDQISADGKDAVHADASSPLSTEFWTCGMHPWVILPAPGLCPICHMDLTPLDPAKLAGEISIDPTTVQNIGVRVQSVQEGPLTKEIRTVGTVSYDETSVRDVNTKISGWIEQSYVNETGQPVRRGDPLFELYSPELYQAQTEYLVARQSRSAIGRGLLDAAREKLELLDVTPEQIQALEQRGEAKKTLTVVSPHTGVVIERNAHEGMKIDSGTRVYRIADLSKVWVQATFYEYQLPYLRTGQPVIMTLPYLPAERFEGKVAYIYPYIDKQARQVKVRLEFPNPLGDLKPGMFANVELQSTLAERAVLAPREGIISTGKREVAFISLGNGRFEPRDVQTGVETENGQIQILEGLQPGEMLVTSGQFLLDSESKMRSALAKMVRGTSPVEPPSGSAVQEPVMMAERPEEAVQQQIDRAVQAYLAAQQSLAGDDAESALKHLAGLGDAAEQIAEADDSALGQEAASLLRAASANAADLPQLRDTFKEVSAVLIGFVRRTPPSAEVAAQLEQAYCSMAEAQWLQVGPQIANPYMGPAMLTCGEIQQTVPSRA